jgi:hypothetical protein
MAFLEEVLSKRDDLDRSTLRGIVDTCRKKTLEEKQAAETQPSIFAKL